MGAENKYFSTSLEKGLKILSLFSADAPSLTQSEISRTIGVNMTSTYRFVNTLVRLGFLEKDAKTKELRLGMRSLALGTNIIRTIDELRLIKGVVDKVHSNHNITIDVVFAIDGNLVRTYHRQATETLTYHLPAVAKNSLHNTSVGKAYLSTLSEDILRQMIVGMSLLSKTPKTIVDKDRLRNEIDKTRQRGYATCDEEYLPGLVTIGAPLINQSTGKGIGGVSFDFSIIQHSAREVEEKYSALIVELGSALSEILQRDDHVN
jgi:DNA-binding IclR family transcriptional regulator